MGPVTFSENSRVGLIAAGIFLATVALFAPAVHHEFVRFDDLDYIVNNPQVRSGLSWAGVRWAFSTAYMANWHPLTWLSHMLDVSLFGLAPSGHHLMGVVLHGVVAALLFWVLRELTAATGRSAVVALLFAVHPLRVESVAWASERKDLLAGLFWLLTLAAWTRWVRTPGIARYLVVLAALAAGLLSKPMLVTLPIVLCILDYWPYGRWSTRRARELVVEKLPLLGLSAISAVITLYAQQAGGAVARLDDVPALARLLNAVAASGVYLKMLLWPTGLAFFYPHPSLTYPDSPLARLVTPALVSGVALGLLVFAAWHWRVRFPYVLTGGLWYAVALAPVVGLVQVGNQALADRYTYVPSIGILVAGVWAAGECIDRFPRWRGVVLVGAATTALLLAGASWRQLATWRDSRVLFDRALRVTQDNYVAHNNMGNLLADEADLSGAARHYERALAIRPDLVEAWNNLGTVQAALGDPGTAVTSYARALELRPTYVEAQFNLAQSLERLGRLEQARSIYITALEERPSLAAALERLAEIAARLGDYREAVDRYRQALAIDELRADAACGLAWFLATSPNDTVRNGDEALVWAERCAALAGPTEPASGVVLAAALAESGEYDRAVRAVDEALARTDPARHAPLLAQRDRYLTRAPWREP